MLLIKMYSCIFTTVFYQNIHIFFYRIKIVPSFGNIPSLLASLKELYFNFYGTFETKNCVHLRLLVYCVFDFILFLLLFTIFLFLCYCCYNLPYSFYTRVDICSKNIFLPILIWRFNSFFYITYFLPWYVIKLIIGFKIWSYEHYVATVLWFWTHTFSITTMYNWLN